jgi:hypothetical protein
MNTRALFLATLSTLFLVGATAQSALAQQIGVRVGVSADPDQFYVGVHGEGGPLIEQLWFRPNVELGVGDQHTLVAVNFEFAYKIELERPWSVYLGGGPAFNLVSNRQTDAEGGFNIVLGLEHSRGLFVEFKVGALDSPDIKFGIGYTFRR